jgi:hypothetical protein
MYTKEKENKAGRNAFKEDMLIERRKVVIAEEELVIVVA